MKSLKIQKGYSQSINRIRTGNAIAKQKKKTNNDLQNTTQKTKERAQRASLKIEGELICSGKVNSSYSISDTRRVTPVTKPVIIHECGKDQEVLKPSGMKKVDIKSGAHEAFLE